MSDHRVVTPLSAPFDLRLRPPGSKSQTIRALVASALATGVSRLHHPLDSYDTRFARSSLAQLGVQIDDGSDPWLVTGSAGRLYVSDEALDAGASGLTGRALIAMAALVDGATTVIGRDRLPERPMGGLLEALIDLGVEVSSEGGRLPVTVTGTGELPGGSVEVSCRETTQFLTALLLTAPLASGPLNITPTGLEGSRGYVAVTVQVMRAFGAKVTPRGTGYQIDPTGYAAAEIEVEPDASAAVYPMVAAAITGSRVTIEGLGTDSLQPDMEIARVLESMGCELSQTADTTTVGSSGRPLEAVDADLSGCPDGALAVAAACLYGNGTSRLRGLGSLRFKESDRVAALAAEIRRLGAEAVVEGDDLIITPGTTRPVRIETYGDHRIAMAFGLVGLVQAGLEVSNPSVVDKTWPEYWDMLEDLASKES